MPTEFEKPQRLRAGDPLDVSGQFIRTVRPAHGDDFEESDENHGPRGRVVIDYLEQIYTALRNEPTAVAYFLYVIILWLGFQWKGVFFVFPPR